MILDVLSSVLLIGGALLALAAGIGVHRFGDSLSRLHAASKPSGLGLLLIALGGALQLDGGAALELIVGVTIAFATIPAGAHIIGTAAEVSGEVPDTDAAPVPEPTDPE